jgi:hypothetical protein
VTDAELEDLVRRFAERSLPKAEWTHGAHLAVGLWHVSRYGRDDALARLRAGITRLNESHGTVNSATGGYHETVTRAYVQLLAAFGARLGDKTLAERVTALLEDPLADKRALFRFYSRAALESVQARLGWIEPDLAPLP